jgi:LacI family transcriptional regulator
VAATDERGSYEATQHLIGLGHTRIGIIVGHPDHRAATDRSVGYQKALLEAGLEIDQDLIQQGDWSFDSGRRGAEVLVDLGHPPTAIVAGDDEMAAGVLRTARNRGIICPDQLSVVGFNDILVASQISPALTTVRQPVVEIARVAAEIVIDEVEHGTSSRRGIMIPTELVIRDSTGPCRPQQVHLAGTRNIKHSTVVTM